MRGYRLFPDVSSVTVEWRPLGLRMRLFTVLWLFFWGFVSLPVFLVSGTLAVVIVLVSMVFAAVFIRYVNTNDPDFVLEERTMLTLLWRGCRRRHITNDPVRE